MDYYVPGQFSSDFNFVRRPKRKTELIVSRRLAVIPDFDRRDRGRLLLKRQRTELWAPRYIPGVSATPTNEPRLNIPKRIMDITVPPKVHTLSDDDRPRSPHQFCGRYVVDDHALRENNSQKNRRYLEQEAGFFNNYGSPANSFRRSPAVADCNEAAERLLVPTPFGSCDK